MSFDVAVIGAGVSGLVTAHDLRRRGHRVVVLERQVRPGGNAVSERVGGFLMEHGPSAINATAPEAARLSSALGLDPLRLELGAGVRRRYLVRAGRLAGIPLHPLGFLTSGYLSWRGRLRLLAEPLVPRRDETAADQTVAAFWRRRFGAEFAERVIDPLVGGLLAGRADRLSMAAAFPRLLEMEREHGSISRAMLTLRRAGGQMPGRRLFSWRNGVGTLPAALAADLGPALRTGVAVHGLRSARPGVRLDVGRAGALDARAVVIATQPHVAAALLDDLDPPAAEAAGSIDAPPLAVVFLGYRRAQIEHPLDGIGCLVARGEQRAVSGVLFCSTMFAGRAPEGHVALAAYLGGARAPELGCLPGGELIDLARRELADLLGARGAPVLARVRQWPRGLPQYGLGHGQRVAALRALQERRPGLFLTGNYVSGPSVASCVAEAEAVAARVDRHLRARSVHAAGARADIQGITGV